MAITPGGLLQGTAVLRTGYIGAGGWATQLDKAADGTILVGTDTTQALVIEPGSGELARTIVAGVNCNADHIDINYGGDPHPWGVTQSYASAIAYSDSQVQYQVITGYVWRTLNGGGLWERTALPQKADCTHIPERMVGKPLVVDPQNPAVVWFAAPDGIHWSDNYGDTWTSISTGTLPAPTAGKKCCIAFDPTSSVSGGKKQGIAIFIYGTGVRSSTNGGTSWTTPTQPTATPTVASHMKYGPNGYLYLTGGGGENPGQFRRWNGSAWLEPSGMLCKTVAISPHNAGHIYAGGSGGGLTVSLDYGATWSPDASNASQGDRIATTIGWHEYTSENYMANGDYEFDPILNRIWCVEGIGVWYVDNPPTTLGYGSNGDYEWIEHSKGLESLVSDQFAINEDGDLGMTFHDRGMFAVPYADIGYVAPATHGSDNGFQFGMDIQSIPGVPGGWVGTTNQAGAEGNGLGYTYDNGRTWDGDRGLKDQSVTGQGGGNIVCFDADNWLVVQHARGFPLAGQANRNGVWRTSNASVGAARTWTLCTIGNNEALNIHGIVRKSLVVDKFAAAGTAYVYNVGDVDDPGGDATRTANNAACQGIWKTTNYGVTWTRVRTNYIVGGGPDSYRGQFQQIGVDDWLWSGGDGCIGLHRSTDGMVTWAAITGTDNVHGASAFAEVACTAVGKAHPNSAFPTIYAMGWRMVTPAGKINGNDWALWYSIDNAATWTRWAQYPGGLADYAQVMEADPLKYGKGYIGFGGHGMQVFDLNDIRAVS